MNFKTFSLASTTIFPITNSKAGGQYVTEWNLRCRDMVPTWSEIEYEVGPSFVHGVNDFEVDVLKDSSGTVISNSTLMIKPGKAIINGHYVKQDAEMTVDLLQANYDLQRMEMEPLHGNLGIGIKAFYSTESSMIGALEPENDEDVYLGIQLIVLPKNKLITPEDSPHDQTKVTCHLKLAEFQFLDNKITGVVQNEMKLRYIDAERIGNIEDIIASNSISNKGIQPKKLYALAGKGINSKEIINNTWCDATDSLFRWDPDPTIVKTEPKHKSAQFDVAEDGKTVNLNLPHKPVGGMVGQSMDENGNIVKTVEYYKELQLPLPIADYTYNTAGTVDEKYTKNVKEISNRLSESFHSSLKGKQLGYIDVLATTPLEGSPDIPKNINDSWNPGDYILVNRDARAIAEENITGLIREPSTMYSILPGLVKGIQFYGVVKDSEELPKTATTDKIEKIEYIDTGVYLTGMQLGNTVTSTEKPVTTKTVDQLDGGTSTISLSLGNSSITPGSVEYTTARGIKYDDSKITDVDLTEGTLTYSDSNNPNSISFTYNALLSNDYNASNKVTIEKTTTTFANQKLTAYTIQVDGNYLEISTDRPYQAYLTSNRDMDHPERSCFFIFDAKAKSAIDSMDDIEPQPVVDLSYLMESSNVVHGLNSSGNIVILQDSYSKTDADANKVKVIKWAEISDNVEDLCDESKSVINQSSVSNGIQNAKLKSKIKNTSSDSSQNVMIYRDNKPSEDSTPITPSSGNYYAVANLSFGDMTAKYTTTHGIDEVSLEDQLSKINNSTGTSIEKAIRSAISSGYDLNSIRGIEFATAALFYNESGSKDITALTYDEFNKTLVNKGIPENTDYALKEIYSYGYRLSAIGPGDGRVEDAVGENTSVLIYARPSQQSEGIGAQRQLWQILEQDKSTMLVNSYYGSLLASETEQDLQESTYTINYKNGTISGLQNLGAATYSYTPQDTHNELMKIFNLENDEIRGVKDSDYFVYKYEVDGHYYMYYYIVSLEIGRTWSDPIWLTGPTYMATEEIVGGFLNVPDTALDAGYVYLNDQGYLQLLDYSLLRSGLGAYQLGDDVNLTGGLEMEDVQNYLDEYVNDRIAFPNSSHVAKTQENIISGSTGINADVNVINLYVELNVDSDSKTQQEIRIQNIDCRFGTVVHLHISGNANSNVRIILADIERLKIDNSISYDESDMPYISIIRCGLFYDPFIMDLVTKSNGKRDSSSNLDIPPNSYETGMSGITLWYNRWDETDPKLDVDGLTVSVVDTPIVPTILEFWNVDSPNDNKFKVALQSIKFSNDGSVIGCGIFIANDSTSNVEEGTFLMGGKFSLPQSEGLSYPKNCLRNKLKITGTFESGYRLGNSEYMIQTTNFTAVTDEYSIYSTGSSIEGNILFHIDAKVISAMFGDVDLEGWSPDKYHVFPGSCMSFGAGN